MKKLLLILLISTVTFSSCSLKKEVVVKTGPQKLIIWNLFDNTDVFSGQIQAFSSQNPGVEISYKKFTNPKFYEKALINELAEGKGPDIFAIKNTWLEKHKGKIEPLRVGATNIAMNEQIYKETFLPVIAKDLIREGKIWGISLFTDTLALYYNKKFFEDHFTSGKPAKTWSGFLQQVEQLTRKNNSIERFSLSGVAMGRSDNIVRALDIFYLLALQYGTQFFDPKINKIIFANDQGRLVGTGEANKPAERALNFYTSFGKSSFKNYSWNDSITARYTEKSEVYPFIAGKTAMIFGYSYLYPQLESIISQLRNSGKTTISKSDIGIAEVPQITAFDESGKRDSLASYWPLVVSKNSENPKLAWDFLLYLSGKESQIDYYEKTNKPSSRIDLIEDQKLQPLFGTFARQAAYSKTFPELVSDSNAYEEVLKNAIDDVVRSKEKAGKVLLNSQAIFQCLLDKQSKKDQMIGVDCLENKQP